MTRGNKAFDVHANSYRVDADVVPCFEHRRYTAGLNVGDYPYISGTEFRPDDGGRVVNWPEQQYANGVAKNKATGGGFKGVTRILKELRYEMENAGVAAAKSIPSYLLECLVWDTPDEGFGHNRVTDDVRYVLDHTFSATRGDESCREWGEVKCSREAA